MKRFNPFKIYQAAKKPKITKKTEEVANEESDDEDEESEYETEEEDEEEDNEPIPEQKFTVTQISEVLKKKGYDYKDLVNLILWDWFDECVEMNTEQNERANETFEYLNDVCYKRIVEVDHRDNRTYANVVSGVSRTEEPGAGPGAGPFIHIDFDAVD
jgi:PP-loop superfamily ATP-utilizing enzyme